MPEQPMRKTADYQARWFRYSEFEWRYMACDIEVARVFQGRGGWVWIVWVPWNGKYLNEQPYYGASWNDEIAKKYAEKRMYGMYWM